MAPRCTRCYHCGVESADNTFKYFNNGKRNQARYECSNCQKLFTLGSHSRAQGRTYAKKRNVDPPELEGLQRECRCCGVADNAPFRFYNNKSLSQPRFQCLSCGQLFQMRLMGTGEERRLVHTGSSSPRSPRNQNPGLSPNSKRTSIGKNEIRVHMSVEPWMPGPEEGKDFPALSLEDARYFDSIEAGLNGHHEAPPPAVVLRLQLWASKLPQRGRPLEAAPEAIP